MTGKRDKGFTIVELMVTIIVLVVLATLVVVRLRFTQQSGRDQERSIDIATIATGLELYYDNGNVTTYTPKGYYPGGAQVVAASNTTPAFNEFLEGVPVASLTAPDRTITTSFGVDPNYASSAPGAHPDGDGSYSDAQATTLLATYPYLYQPLQRNNTFCANYINCVKFNLYYLEEATNNVIKIRSKHQ